MADLHLLREHKLGLSVARKIALQWAEQAEKEFGMACTYADGKSEDEVVFTRIGVQGKLRVTKSQFEVSAKLGFLLGPFKELIEREIVKNLDTLLQAQPPSPRPSPTGGRGSKSKTLKPGTQ